MYSNKLYLSRTFSVKAVGNPRASSLDRVPSSLDRVPSLNSTSNSQHRNGADLTDSRVNDSHSYMSTWDASSVANRMSATSSSDWSPMSSSESPRVRKPLVCM